MGGDRRRLVEEIFQQAADLPAGERSAFLAGRCDGDTSLRSEVESLLAAFDEGTTGLLGTPPVSVLTELEGAEKTGDTVGRYRLCEVLGEGGFGTVYRAEQTEPIRREVALKVIKLGMDTRRVVARFEAERQALAIMDHPNLASVLDAGATERGRPYFVMELVRGEPITRYCDERRLGVEARLGLFLQICEAVQHAHQKGLIHRDLKPSNILVTESGGKPLVKVIDFGIAKAMAGGAGNAATLATEVGHVIGTPAYMSPEQAGALGGDVDTRTDIYSLGVVLYELLTGSTPLDLRRASGGGLGEMQRVIREQEPERPSTRVRTAGDRTAEIATRRGADPANLHRRLRGDLDWITMRAMEKDRARRYDSVAELAAELRRHLAHESVLAGPPGAAYRTRKFVRRHRAGVAVAALATIGLAGTTIGTGVGLVRARRAELHALRTADREAAQRALAERRFAQVRELANTLIFKVYDAVDDLAGSTEARRLIVDTGLRYVDGLAEEAEGDTRLQLELAAAYRRLGEVLGDPAAANLGDKPGAMASYQKSLEIARAAAAGAPGNRDAQASLMESQRAIGDMHRVMGGTAEAVEAYTLALGIAQSLAASDPTDLQAEEDVAMLHASLGRMHEATGRYEEAIASLEEYLKFSRKRLADNPGDARLVRNQSVIFGKIALLLGDLGRWDEAVAIHRQQVDELRRLSAANPNDATLLGTLASSYTNLGSVLSRSGRAEESLPYLREAMETWERAAAADPNDKRARRNVAVAHYWLGWAHEKLGQYEKALEHFEAYRDKIAALAATEPEYLVPQRDLAIAHESMSRIFQVLGRNAEAAEAAAAGIAINERLMATDPSDVLHTITLAVVVREHVKSLLNLAGDADAPTEDRLRHLATACEQIDRGLAISSDLALRGVLVGMHADLPASFEAYAKRAEGLRAELAGTDTGG